MLELQNISWSTPDGRRVLDDVSLVIGDSGLVAITGPNGGGKTTLAKIIAGKGLTVRDLLGIASPEPLDEAGLCMLLSKVGLCAKDYVDRDVDASLSGGEIKRIEIATVLARRTKLSIFDEPEAGIDLWSFAGLIDAFSEMKASGGTEIIISHQERILSIADRIIVIENGRVKEDGNGHDVLGHILHPERCPSCPAGLKEAFHE